MLVVSWNADHMVIQALAMIGVSLLLAFYCGKTSFRESPTLWVFLFAASCAVAGVAARIAVVAGHMEIMEEVIRQLSSAKEGRTFI